MTARPGPSPERGPSLHSLAGAPGAAGSAWASPARNFLRVTGDDAGSFLQGQLSQDVLALDSGGSALSFVLHPDGKVAFLVRVSRIEGAFVLDVDEGCGSALAERLLRFRLRVKVELEEVPWHCVSVFTSTGDTRWAVGHTGGTMQSGGVSDEGPATAPGEDGVTGAEAVVGLLGVPEGFDLIGPEPSPPAGAVRVDARRHEVYRILDRFPAAAYELAEPVIPEETGMVARAVSFTKGCYTGQELVERIASRGAHVPRRLRVVASRTGSVVAQALDTFRGAELKDAAGADVGHLTSAEVAGSCVIDTSLRVHPGGDDRIVALGYVRRSIVPPATVYLDDGREMEVIAAP